MTRANQLYESLAECLNLFDDLTLQELCHIACLIAAQLPHAEKGLIDIFHHADAHTVDQYGEGLVRIRAGVEPATTAFSGALVKHQLPPEEGEPIPVVHVKRVAAGKFAVCREGTIILCKFHEQRFPTAQDFIDNGADVIAIIFSYSHVDGSCKIRINKPPGSSMMELSGNFTLGTFIPVKVIEV